jgi:hypothetical protein
MPILRSGRPLCVLFAFAPRKGDSPRGPGNLAAAQVGMSVAAGRWTGLGGAARGIGRGVT